MSLYTQLHRMGCCHSVETWRDGKLVGGLYGVRIGAVFFGESMFSRVTDASKVALVHLVARLNAGGFKLLDAQFVNPHLERLGAVKVPKGRVSQHDGAAARAWMPTSSASTAIVTRNKYLETGGGAGPEGLTIHAVLFANGFQQMDLPWQARLTRSPMLLPGARIRRI